MAEEARRVAQSGLLVEVSTELRRVAASGLLVEVSTELRRVAQSGLLVEVSIAAPPPRRDSSYCQIT